MTDAASGPADALSPLPPLRRLTCALGSCSWKPSPPWAGTWEPALHLGAAPSISHLSTRRSGGPVKAGCTGDSGRHPPAGVAVPAQKRVLTGHHAPGWLPSERPDCYGVIAMATGKLPTLIAFPALLVTVLIGVTECEPLTA